MRRGDLATTAKARLPFLHLSALVFLVSRRLAPPFRQRCMRLNEEHRPLRRAEPSSHGYFNLEWVNAVIETKLAGFSGGSHRSWLQRFIRINGISIYNGISIGTFGTLGATRGYEEVGKTQEARFVAALHFTTFSDSLRAFSPLLTHHVVGRLWDRLLQVQWGPRSSHAIHVRRPFM